MTKKELIKKVVKLGILDEANAKKMTKKMLQEVIRSDLTTVEAPLELDIDEVTKDELVEQAVDNGILTEDSAERMTKGMIIDVLDDVEVVEAVEMVSEPVKKREQTKFKITKFHEDKPFIRITAKLMTKLKKGLDHKDIESLLIIFEEYGSFYVREVDRVKRHKLSFVDGKAVIEK